MATFTIETPDFPIFSKYDTTQQCIPIPDSKRSILTDALNPTHPYDITKILICEPITGSTNSFNILFVYGDTSNIYLQVPVTIANVSPKFINKEFTQLINEFNTSASIQFNLTELLNALPANYTISSGQGSNIFVIKYDAVYLKVSKPTTISSNPLNRITVTPSATSYTVKMKTLNNTIMKCKKNEKYNPDSKDPTRTLRVDAYDGKDMKTNNGVKQEYLDNLSRYTGLMMVCIVAGFILVTLYVIVVLIPDSKLNVIYSKPIVGGSGGRTIRQVWNNIYKRFAYK